MSESRPTATALKSEIEMLQAEIATLESRLAGHQTEFRTIIERDRAEQHLAGLLRMTPDVGAGNGHPT
jgi:prefoldin subunit 5